MQVEQLEPPMSATLGATKYFEVQSEHVGARFAVWVTLPLQYAHEPNSRYPAIYQPDGNLWAPMSAPIHPLLRHDPINPIVSFIQVSVGYVGEDVARALAVRARDLLPPGEPLAAGTSRAMMDGLVDAGVLDKTGADLYWHNLHNPAADRFLAFLSEELHPWIASEYRVEESATGLFGYSYGGLFATYAALRRTRFRRIGAGSPGIVSRTSKVFEAYEAELAAGADHSGRMLHMTVCERELTVPSFYQVGVGGGTAEFMTLAGMRPLRGLTFSAHIAPLESHASGGMPSWFSFLRACYAASGSTDLLKVQES